LYIELYNTNCESLISYFKDEYDLSVDKILQDSFSSFWKFNDFLNILHHKNNNYHR